jgi:2'-5' RNA ligase
MRPNWFIAFPVVTNLVDDVPPVPANFRRFAAEDVHLTISFLGACGEQQAQIAWTAVREQLAQSSVPRLTIQLGPVVPMGSSKSYTALSALLAEGWAEVSQAMKRLRNVAADAAGLRRDERPPKPHVTIARPRRRASAEQRREGLAWAARVDVSHIIVSLDSIALYTWAEPRNHRLFQIVAQQALP